MPVVIKGGYESYAQAAIALQIKKRVEERQSLLRYTYDPAAYLQDKLGWSPWKGTPEMPGQQEVIDAYVLALRQQHEKNAFENGEISEGELVYWKPGQVIQNRLRVEAGHTVGKCVAASEYITLADGRRVQAGDLIDQEFVLPTLHNGDIVPAAASAAFNAIETVYELITESGKRIVRNAQHPVWAATAVFAGGKRPVVTVRGWQPIGALTIGDLVAVAEALPQVPGPSPLSVEAVKIIAYLLGDGSTTQNAVRFTQQDNAQLAEFRDCCAVLGCVVDHVGKYDYVVYGENRRKDRQNAVLALCRDHGLMKVGARAKRVPAAVFQLPERHLRLFLSRLYSTDGWASVARDGAIDIGYCSASPGFVQDVQELLLRFGVHARIAYRPKVNAWTLSIRNRLDAMRFIEQIGIFGKEEAVEKVRQACRHRVDSHARTIQDRPDQPRWAYKDAVPGTRWEKVVAVRPVGIEPTIAIEVPGHETYLTTLWEHNTKISSGLVNHFFDCFVPSIVYTFAPSFEQVHDLLWKEIKADRAGKNLPGRILDLAIIRSPNHFAKGRAASDAQGAGSERVQGQHGKYLMFVLDEAEGIADFVWDAVNSMTSGGISIVLMLANPRTRASRFHRIAELSTVKSFRISCLWHPNVLEGREIIPGAVRRDYVETMIEEHCEQVDFHIPDDYTFEVHWRPGRIYRPDAEFLFRVLGIAPANLSDNTFIPIGRYETACHREPDPHDHPEAVRFGVDVARYGNDLGTIYCRHKGRVWRVAQMAKLDTVEYTQRLITEIMPFKDQGVTSVHVRVDGGGGFGGGVIDQLKRERTLAEAFPDFQVFEVHFNASPRTPKSYADLVTEMYADASDALQTISIDNPPTTLEADLCERPYRWATHKGLAVKELEPKEIFKRRIGRSPDDGDGFVLAVAGDHLFRRKASVWFV